MRPCFAFTPAAKAVGSAAAKPATLSILEDIGFWGTQAKDFRAQLDAVEGEDLRVEISSPGGDVFAGVAMYNSLRASGKNITTVCLGVAASVASLVYLAGDTREIPENGMLMIHNPWSFAVGNAEELRETAEMLDKVGSSVNATYLARTGMKAEDLTAMMAKDTWLDADEAVQHGFATAKTSEVKVKALFDLDKAELPEAALKAYMQATGAPPKAKVVTPPEPAPAPAAKALVADESPLADQIVVLAKAAGLEMVAGDLALNCQTLADAQARIANGREIMALARVAGQEAQGPVLLRKNTSVADARASLVKAAAEADAAAPTNTQRPADPKQSSANSATAPVTTDSIWASHRSQSKSNRT